MKTKFRFVTLILVLAFVLQACGSNTTTNSSSSSTSSSTSSSSSESSSNDGVLTIAMTAGNIPVPNTIPTEGSEGLRFVGFQLYDGLFRWDLSSDTEAAVPKPALAESYEVSEDLMTWTFNLRHGVTFHDGTPWDADAAIFNLDRVMNPEFEYYDAKSAGGVANYTKWIASYSKINDFTIQMVTKEPYSLLNWELTWVLFGSPTAIKELGADFSTNPVGTGPFKFVELKEGQSMTMARNDEYWGDKAKVSKVILRPMADAASRLAALQSGEVNWAELPPPEAIASLESRGFQIYLNAYPHVLPFMFNMQNDIWSNKLVRQAANYAIDRATLAESLLNGAGEPATGLMYPGQSWYNSEATQYSYDPEKAKALLAEAGYPNGVDTTFVIPIAGSGNMWPQPISEYVQKNLAEVGINVKLEVMEWSALLETFASGFPEGSDYGAVMISTGTYTPIRAIDYNFAESAFSPVGNNRGKYTNPEVEALINQIKTASGDDVDKYMQQATAVINDDAPWLFLLHDKNLRALAPNVKGFVMAQSWFQDLTTISVE